MKLRELIHDLSNIDYFESQYYEQILVLTQEYLAIFKNEVDWLTKAGSYTPPKLQTSCNQLENENNVTTFNNAAHGPINKINARMAA